MAYDTLKGLIRQYIKTNGQNEITGQILQNILIAMVDEYPSLTGYATQQWVQSQGYLTDADLSNYATQTWVNTQLLGYLPTSTALINAVVQSADGSIKLSGRNFADTYLDFTHTHRFEELTDLPTLLQDFGITGGTLLDLEVALLSVGTTLTVTNGNDYISIDGNGIAVYDETAGSYTIGVSASGDMLVGAGVVANSFVKSGGTSSQFLKADGSVDSNAYITSAALTGYATQSWVGQNYLSLNNGGTVNDTVIVSNGNDYISLDGNGIAVYDETAGSYTIGVSASGDMLVGAGVVANSFVKSGGTSSQFLKADGSVDSNTYATQSWVQQQGYITSAALTGYATQTWVGQYFVPISATYINEVTKSDDGTLKFAGSNFADTYIDFTHTHRFEELTDLPTLLQDFGITGGTLSDLSVALLSVGTTLTVSNGNDYVSIDGNGITVYDETAGPYTIGISASGDMLVGAGVVANSFVKSGGTSSQFLKADGSVDSNAYITSAALSGYATQSWVQQQGYLTSSSLSGYATQSWVNSNYLPTSTALVNTLAKSADGSMKFSGRNFADTYVDFTHDHRWEEIVDRPNIEIGGYGMTYTDGKFGVGIKVPSYPIDVDGSVRATSFINSSDARLKDIEDYDADISAEAVALAPAVHYQWKNRKDKTAMVGSIAQYWQNVLPEAVSTDDKGFLSMQYDVIALISAISIAKRTVEHEQRIAELESENALLRLELNSIKEAIKTT